MNENQKVSSISFNSIKDYPESLLLYIDKYVKVSLIKHTSFSGFLHSIDPISHSIILSVPNEGKFQTTIIPGHAIVDMHEEINEQMIPPSRKKPLEAVDQNNISLKKTKLMAWFKKNLLPVSENEENLILGNVSILPPYRVIDICADNPVVALQMRKIMESMPPDYEAL